MNKKKLIESMYDEFGYEKNLTKNDMKEMIELLFDSIKSQLVQGEPVSIVGFGKFDVRNRVERIGRNPQTGDTLVVPATKSPSFSPSKNLRDLVRKG
ncbi:MAG: HU family DNA-binding protein [Candidatus Marinamargulisbacteria bacterium]|nr:HU family DNA-binding protein [Candidatus Marinamargulisbacteria bacterium]